MADFCLDCARRLVCPRRYRCGSRCYRLGYLRRLRPGWFDDHGKRVTEELSQESQQSQEYPVSRWAEGGVPDTVRLLILLRLFDKKTAPDGLQQ